MSFGAWIKSFPAKIAALKQFVIDPLDNTFCVVRTSVVGVVGSWLVGVGVNIHTALHTGGPVDIKGIALSGGGVLASAAAAVTGKSYSKRKS
jgi:hypothetical protein